MGNGYFSIGDSMPIVRMKGSIFDSECECIVNPTNSIGVMGAGLARDFINKFPVSCNLYNEISRRLLAEQGAELMEPWINPVKDDPWYVMMFATKIDWRHPSKKEYLEENLPKAIELLKERQISSVAFPLLGAGLGGLNKQEVLEIMERHLQSFPGRVEIWTK